MSVLKISQKNSKLGNIASFSLTCVESCPGRTAWCEKYCYAKRIEWLFKKAKAAYKSNFEATKVDQFIADMHYEIKKLREKKIKYFRIHVSGDFYDAAYIKRWITIIKSNPDIIFTAYTKSWRIKSLRVYLKRLNSLNNMVLFASVDSDTLNEVPPVWLRQAYAGTEQPPKTVICLEQNNKVKTCEQCRLCFNKLANSTIFFIKH